jgi:CubicO group peptidase (beta-lactamase class C family)
MSKWKKRAIELITGLALTGKTNPAVVPFTPSKTEFSAHETKHFKRTTPERRGVSSRRIYDMLSALEADKRANVHNIMVIKDGEVISECSHPGYDVNIRHLSHSMSKTVTGMAIGLLVSQGSLSLDDRLADIFPEYTPTDSRFYNITVKNLLNMSSGIPFSEFGTVTETEWTRAIFESKLSFDPGTNFAYNSMNSYMLARIVVRITGISLMHFVTNHIFKPLDIKNAFWEEGPEGVEKGGWGLYLSAESWAKLGVMMLGLGVFEGKRVLPKSWVSESITTQMKSPEASGDYNYGYQLWVHRERDQFLFNGMLGQNVWVCPKNNIVVSVNCENNELFQKSAVLEIIENYLGGNISRDSYDSEGTSLRQSCERHFFESRHWIRPLEKKRGITYRLGLRNAMPFDKRWSDILGSYSFPQNNHGILPLFIRVMHNNYSGGIESISLEREGESLFFTSREGGIDYRLEVGFYDFKTTVLNFNGERFIVRAIAESIEDEDRKKIYKLELLFPEMPNSRKIKLSLEEDGKIMLRMTEIPNEKIAEPFVESIYMTNPKLAFAVRILERRLGDRFINKKLESMFSPTLIGADKGNEKYYDIIANERARAEEAIQATKAISSLILNAADSIKDE